MKIQVLLTVWCNISGEAAGEIWHWSLSGVKGLLEEMKYIPPLCCPVSVVLSKAITWSTVWDVWIVLMWNTQNLNGRWNSPKSKMATINHHCQWKQVTWNWDVYLVLIHDGTSAQFQISTAASPKILHTQYQELTSIAALMTTLPIPLPLSGFPFERMGECT